MFLKRVLRDTWNFTGVVTSDSGAIDEIFCKEADCRKIGGDRGHEYRNWTAEQATAAAITAGVDIDSGTCIAKDPDGWSVYATHTASAVNQSLLSWAEVDDALRHAFTLRFKLGLLDPIGRQPFWKFGPEVIGSDAHRNLSARASERSLVLLTNDNNTLPLQKGLNLAVIGPTADSRAAIVGGTGGCGASAAHPNWACLEARFICKDAKDEYDFHCIASIYDALVTANAGGSVVYEQGSNVSTSNSVRLKAAVAAAVVADVTVLVIGDVWSDEQEGRDRTNITLSAPQLELFDAVKQASGTKPVIVVLVHGGCLDLDPLSSASAIIDAFLPGQFGAAAIAKAIFGATNSFGKLPQTYYRTSYLNAVSMDEFSFNLPPGRGHRYLPVDSPHVVFPAFHGLSFTTFSIAIQHVNMSLSLSTSNDDARGSFVRVSLTNTGANDGDEIVLAFMRPVNRSSPTAGALPLRRQLIHFRRVTDVARGSTVAVDFAVAASDLSLVDGNGDRWVEPGRFELIFSRGHGAEVAVPLELSGPRRLLERLPSQSQPGRQHGTVVKTDDAAATSPPPRRVMAWMSADCFNGIKATSCLGGSTGNITDIERQAAEALRRAAAKQLTDLSPTTYKFGPNGTVLYDRCGMVCERLQPKFAGAGLRVFPLVAAFGIRPIIEYALKYPVDAADSLVNLTLMHGYAGINLDLEPLDCQHCVSPSNCTVETWDLRDALKPIGLAAVQHNGGWLLAGQA
jgi:hypothetical protein